MKREILVEMRKSCMIMAGLAMFFVFIYVGVSLIVKLQYDYFEGFVPSMSANLFRAVFYGISIISIVLLESFKKRRLAPEKIRKASSDPGELVRLFVITAAFAISIAEVPLICGFLLFFFKALYTDLYILSAVTAVLIIINVPSVSFWERKLREGGAS